MYADVVEGEEATVVCEHQDLPVADGENHLLALDHIGRSAHEVPLLSRGRSQR